MRWPLMLSILMLSAPAAAQDTVSQPSETLGRDTGMITVPVCSPPAVCVPEGDMQKIVTVLREKKCQQIEKPEFKLDPIQIIVDKQGRVFFTGADPKPYTLKMTWCDYEITARGKVNVVAAMRQPSIWGFRLRPKAYMGILPSEVFYDSNDPRDLGDFMDAGVMVDFLYYDWANLNAAMGYRSVGAGGGIDLTENFGSYAGYAVTWGSWHHNVNIGLWFSFWNP